MSPAGQVAEGSALLAVDDGLPVEVVPAAEPGLGGRWTPSWPGRWRKDCAFRLLLFDQIAATIAAYAGVDGCGWHQTDANEDLWHRRGSLLACRGGCDDKRRCGPVFLGMPPEVQTVYREDARCRIVAPLPPPEVVVSTQSTCCPEAADHLSQPPDGRDKL